MPRTPPPSDDDPLDAFELPPELMSHTLEHAIGDAATERHELGHGVAARLQGALKGSTVDYSFPGMVTVHLRSGAVARCGGPAIGWLVDVVRRPGAEPEMIDVGIADDETDAERIADALTRVLRRR